MRIETEGTRARIFSLVGSLKNCAEKKDLDEGIRLHDNILKGGLLQHDTHLGNTLVSMYAKCGALSKACQVLEQLPLRDVVSWSAIISGYVQQGQGEAALYALERMQSEGLAPDAIAYACILKACSITGAIDRGEQIHEEVVNGGWLGKSAVLGTALINMYTKCGLLIKARQALDDLPIRDVVSWSALIAGYAQEEQGEEALECFKLMRDEGLSPDAFTYSCTLKACGSIGAIDKGEEIHNEISSQGLLGKNVVVGTALVDMYAKCGLLMKAHQVLDQLPVRNVISWSALIAGYAQRGQGEAALNCFERMQSEGLSPNAVTYICILKACGITRAGESGERIHDHVASAGLLGDCTKLGNLLIDMYGKCGMLTKAQQVFDKLPVRDEVSWSALIGGYAQQGQVEQAFECFKWMQSEGISPGAIIYSGVVNACSIRGDEEDKRIPKGETGKGHVEGEM